MEQIALWRQSISKFRHTVKCKTEQLATLHETQKQAEKSKSRKKRVLMTDHYLLNDIGISSMDIHTAGKPVIRDYD